MTVVPAAPIEEDDATAAQAAEFSWLESAYRAYFGAYPPVVFMPVALGIEVMREALRRGEAAPPEAWPQPGCNCA